MAVKIDKPVDPAEQRQAAARERAAAEAAELEVLHPDLTIEIAGRTLTVREYTYIEGMRLQGGARAFLDDLYAAFSRDGQAAAGEVPRIDDVNELLATHIVVVQWMIAHAITPLDDQRPDEFVQAVRENARWIATLDEVEGDILSVAWWGVNRGFFTRRLLRRAQADQVRNSGTSASPSSTPR